MQHGNPEAVIAILALLFGSIIVVGGISQRAAFKKRLIERLVERHASASLILEIRKEKGGRDALLEIASGYLTAADIVEFTTPTKKANTEKRNRTVVEAAPADSAKEHMAFLDRIGDFVQQQFAAQHRIVETDLGHQLIIAAERLYFDGANEEQIQKALATYIRLLPAPPPYPITQPCVAAVDIYELTNGVMSPLRDTKAYKRFLENTVKATKQFRKTGQDLMFPQQFPKDPALIPHVYFEGTGLEELFAWPVPYPLYDKTRFEHHFVLGARGKGKSTLLKNLITADLAREPNVAVVLIDSQFEMTNGFARAADPHGALISPDRPVPLNPFINRSVDEVVDIITYALGGASETDLTHLQTTPLEFVVRAVAQHPRATLRMVEEFFSHPQEVLIAKADRETKEYFASPAWTKLPEPTRSGILQRIALLKKNTQLWKMLNADDCIAIEDTLNKGMSIIVDTNKSKLSSDRTRVFGRIIIAFLHTIMRRRVDQTGAKKPVFVYIDELPDYCPIDQDDSKLRELLDQSRKQNIGFTLASQREDQINAKVLGALKDSAIISRCLEPGRAEVSVYDKKSIVTVPEFSFGPLIDDDAFAKRHPPLINRQPPPEAGGPMSFDEP